MKSNIKSTGLIVSCVMLLSKLFGMLRDIIIASMYGTATVEAISFSTASRIPLLFFDIALGTAVTSAFIPIYNEYLAKDDRESANNFANRFIFLVFAITLSMTIIGCVFSGGFVNIIAGGLNESQSALSSMLVKILFPVIIFTGIAFCLVGILQSEGNFVIPALISLVSNLFLILYLVIFKDRFGVTGVAIAMLIGWFLQIVIQIPSLKKSPFVFKIKNPFGDNAIKRVCILSLPIIISAWVQPINAMININLASGLNDGEAITALDYANKLYIILVGVVAYTITNLTFPSISRYASGNDYRSYSDTVAKSIRYSVFVIAPVMVGFIVLSAPIIRLFYERGQFTSDSTFLTSKALMCYSFGMIGYGMTEIMNKSFYALKNGKTPMTVSCIGIGLNIVISLVSVKLFNCGLEGVALAAAFSSNFIGITMLIILNKRVGGILNAKFVVNVLKPVVSAMIMGVVVYLFTVKFAFSNVILSVIVPAFVGAVIYAVCCILFKVDEFKSILSLLDKFKKKEA